MILADSDIEALCVPGKFGERSAALSWMEPPSQPMLSPYSPPISGSGVISSGLTHAGYDLRLGDEVWMVKDTYHEPLDPKRMKDAEYLRRVFDIIKPERGRYVLPPGGYCLGVSLERICMPNRLKGRCVGKSTLARCAVLINTTPLEPSWVGHLTIEISNLSPLPSYIYAGEGIAQLEFEVLTCTPRRDYAQGGAKYQDQVGVTPARVLE